MYNTNKHKRWDLASTQWIQEKNKADQKVGATLTKTKSLRQDT